MLSGKLIKLKVFLIVLLLFAFELSAWAQSQNLTGTGEVTEKKTVAEKKTEKKQRKNKKEEKGLNLPLDSHDSQADLAALNTRITNLLSVTQAQQQLIAGQEAEINKLIDTGNSLKNNLQSITGELKSCKQEKEVWLNSDREAKARLLQQVNLSNEILKGIDISKNAIKALSGFLSEGLEARLKQQKYDGEQVNAGEPFRVLTGKPEEKPEKPEKNEPGGAINSIAVIFDEQSFMPLIKTLAATAVKTKQVSISQQGDFIIIVSGTLEDNCSASVKVFRNEKLVKQFNVGGC